MFWLFNFDLVKILLTIFMVITSSSRTFWAWSKADPKKNSSSGQIVAEVHPGRSQASKHWAIYSNNLLLLALTIAATFSILDVCGSSGHASALWKYHYYIFLCKSATFYQARVKYLVHESFFNSRDTQNNQDEDRRKVLEMQNIADNTIIIEVYPCSNNGWFSMKMISQEN